MTQNKTSSFRTYFWIFAIILIIITLFLILPQNNASDPNDELENIALGINLKTPKLLDSITRLDSVKVLAGNKFQCNLTLLNLPKARIDTTVIVKEGKQLFIKGLKNGYGFAFFKTYKIPLVYNFYDSSGVYVCRFQIEPREYQ